MPRLAIGLGFFGKRDDDGRSDDAELFARLRGVVTGVIWFGAYSVAGSIDGMAFCQKIAKLSGCYVVAPGITVSSSKVGHNEIELFSRSMPHYFAPDGEKAIAPSEFFKLDRALGFKLYRVQ